MAKHMRRSRLTFVGRGVAAGTTLVVAGVFVGSAGAAPLGEVVPAPPPPVGEVQLGPAIQVSRDNPTPHPPPEVAPVRRVARVVSPCSAKRAQLAAVEAEIRTAYRTPTALELAEDGAVIASAIAAQCGWEAGR